MRYKILFFLISLVLIYSCGTDPTPVYTLTTTVSPLDGGDITPLEGEYEEGEIVTLTGTPSNGWRFVRWEGDWNDESNPVNIEMIQDYNIAGVFERIKYPLTITIEGEGDVEQEIISSPKSTEYPFETVVQLTAKPNDGWVFYQWNGDLSGDENPLQITIDGEMKVTVNFLPTVFLGENGITIMCPNGKVGNIGVVNGVDYEVVDNDLIRERLEEGRGSFSRNVCVTKVTDMSRLFVGLNFNEPIGDWDVSNVRDMNRIFSNSSFNQPIDEWDVSNMTNMEWVFFNSQFNQPIENWDVSKVTDMNSMFWSSEFNQSIEKWDVSNVTDMTRMFLGSKFNQTIGDWDVSNVKVMREMFRSSQFNQPIGNWDVSKVTDMFEMFNRSQFNQSIGNWNVSNVTNMSSMFSGFFQKNTRFNQPIGDWDVSNVRAMYTMFSYSSFNQPIGNWDVSNVTNMNSMFYRSFFNQNITNWCVWRIRTEPSKFSTNSPLTLQNKPKWGTCPD